MNAKARQTMEDKTSLTEMRILNCGSRIAGGAAIIAAARAYAHTCTRMRFHVTSA